VFLALLFLAAALSPDTGEIWVQFAPGAVVYLDGARAGVTDVNESGVILHDVKEGKHQIRLEVANGASATMDVNVTGGETASVAVSPIALRARVPKGGIEVRLAAPDPQCVAAVNDLQQPVSSPAVFDELAPGAYHVRVTCGARGVVQSDATVNDGRIAVLEADVKTRKLNFLGERPRVTRVTLPDPNKAIVKAPLPADVKRALINALTSGMTVSSINVPRADVVSLSVTAPNVSAAGYFLDRMQRSGVARVQLDNYSQAGEDGEVRLSITLWLNG
jgi:hypothetical protein